VLPGLYRQDQAYPPADRKCEFADMVIQGEDRCHGPVALARWGISCAFAGSWGRPVRSIDPGVPGCGRDRHLRSVIRRGTHSQFAFIATERARKKDDLLAEATGFPLARRRSTCERSGRPKSSIRRTLQRGQPGCLQISQKGRGPGGGGCGLLS